MVLISVRERDKPGAVVLARRSSSSTASSIVATDGTAKAITEAGVACKRANKVREGRPHIVDMIKNDEIAMIVNTTEGKTGHPRVEFHPPRSGAQARHLLHDARRRRSQPAKLSIIWTPSK